MGPKHTLRGLSRVGVEHIRCEVQVLVFICLSGVSFMYHYIVPTDSLQSQGCQLYFLMYSCIVLVPYLFIVSCHCRTKIVDCASLLYQLLTELRLLIVPLYCTDYLRSQGC